MKTLKYYLFLLTGFVLSFSGCSDEKEIIVIPEENISVKIDNLYGTGSGFDWSYAPLLKVDEEESIFTAEIKLTHTAENKQFKFTLETGDWDKIRYLVPTEVDYGESVKIITSGVEYPMFACSEIAGNLRDHFWGIANASKNGIYRITVNYVKNTMKAEKISEAKPDPDPEPNSDIIYGLGKAFNWEVEPLLAQTPGSNVFVFETTLIFGVGNENKLFKFEYEDLDWSKAVFMVPTEVDYNGSTKIIESGKEYNMQETSEATGLKDWFWGLPNASANGIYRITVNTKTLKLSVEKIGDVPDNPDPTPNVIYGLGKAFDWTVTPVPAQALDSHVHVFERVLTFDAENKLFKFEYEDLVWNAATFMVPTAVDYNGYTKIIGSGQEYDMQETSEATGLKDWFWGLPNASANGTYRITVNTETLKLRVEKL